MGDRLPIDHHYRLYSALILSNPLLKQTDWALGTITGIADGGGWIKLGRKSYLSVRVPIASIELFELDRQILRIGQSLIQLGEMVGHSLQPIETLTSRIVIIKLGITTRIDPIAFALSLGKQIGAAGLSSSLPTIGDQQIIRVADNPVVGYAVRFDRLPPRESLWLQTHGLGAKRRMGCGCFA